MRSAQEAMSILRRRRSLRALCKALSNRCLRSARAAKSYRSPTVGHHELEVDRQQFGLLSRSVSFTRSSHPCGPTGTYQPFRTQLGARACSVGPEEPSGPRRKAGQRAGNEPHHPPGLRPTSWPVQPLGTTATTRYIFCEPFYDTPGTALPPTRARRCAKHGHTATTAAARRAKQSLSPIPSSGFLGAAQLGPIPIPLFIPFLEPSVPEIPGLRPSAGLAQCV